MKFKLFLENNNKKYYHGSSKKFMDGSILVPQSDHDKNWSINAWYNGLEHFRPNNMLPRKQAVFMTDNINDVGLAGGVEDYIYLVEPLGKVEKHDVNWISEIEGLIDSTDDQDKIDQAAKNYWSSIPHYNEQVWEYLTPIARIVKLVAGELSENTEDIYREDGDFYSVLVNPTQTELQKLGKHIRGFVNNNVYFWDIENTTEKGAKNILHFMVAKDLGLLRYHPFIGYRDKGQFVLNCYEEKDLQAAIRNPYFVRNKSFFKLNNMDMSYR